MVTTNSTCCSVPRPRFGVAAAIIALALGSFGIGATEFVAMGLLPEMTRDLLAAEFAQHPEQALGQASWLVTAYALGVVVGAPLMIALQTRLTGKQALLLFVAIFAGATVVTLCAPNFWLAVVCRFFAALPHGAYFGVAPLVAGQLLGAGKRGTGVAYVLLGLTVCNLAGVPVFTALGQNFGWRVAYLVIALVFVLALLAIFLTVPNLKNQIQPSLGSQLAAFKSILLWIAVLVVATGMAGYFALYAYVAPVVTDLAYLQQDAVPFVLACAGCGMTLGTLLGGKIADNNARLGLRFALLSFFGCLVFTVVTAHLPVCLFVGVFCSSISASMMVPPAQLWLMDIAYKAPVLGGALVHAAFNLANASGAAGAGLVIALGLGFRAPIVFGAIMALLGALSFLLVAGYQKRHPISVTTATGRNITI